MAVLYITEYAQMARVEGANQPIPMEPVVASQTVAIGGGSTQSAAFNAATKFVELETDAICSVLFGTNPTATTGKTRMAANAVRYVGVPPNQAYKVAVISNT